MARVPVLARAPCGEVFETGRGRIAVADMSGVVDTLAAREESCECCDPPHQPW